MADSNQTNVSPCIEADCRQHCGTFRVAKVSAICECGATAASLWHVYPACSEWFKCCGKRTGNWQLATGKQPLACIRIRNYDALTFWNIVAWLDYSLQSLPLPWLSLLILWAVFDINCSQLQSPLSTLYCSFYYDRFLWKLLLFSHFFYPFNRR